MALGIKSNFSIGNVIDPTQGAQRALSQVGSIMSIRQDAADKEADRKLKEQAMLQQQANSDRSFGLQEQNAEDTAVYRTLEQNNRLEGLRLAADTRQKDLEYEAEKSKRLAAYQNKVYNETINQNQFTKDQILGASEGEIFAMPETTEVVPGTVREVDPVLATQQLNEFNSTLTPVGPAPTNKSMLVAYDEYAKKNDPTYGKSNVAQLSNAYIQDINKDGSGNVVNRSIPGYSFVKDNITDPFMNMAVSHFKSDEDKVKAEIAKEDMPKQEPILSKEEFIAKQKADYQDRVKYVPEAKAAIAKWLATDKDSTAIKDIDTNTVERVPVDILKTKLVEQMNNKIAEDKVNGIGTSASKRSAMLATIAKRVNKVSDTRDATDALELKTLMKNMDTQQKQMFNLKLAAYKADRKDNKPPTNLEMVQLANAIKDGKLKDKKL